ncbi:class I SAM-dependent methyltransferase [Bradyrhizobium sp. 179]|nr:class I SAM-dependent methyltransferase [Bradyrhizobium sp. 179]
MVEIASQRNRPLIEAARAEVILATVESLPFADNFFDKVLCVHVLYFWKDFDVSLREIARVLKPGADWDSCSEPRPIRRPSHRFRPKSTAFRSSPK